MLELRGNQLLPPSVVLINSPDLPAAIPVSLLRKDTQLREFPVGLGWSQYQPVCDFNETFDTKQTKTITQILNADFFMASSPVIEIIFRSVNI